MATLLHSAPLRSFLEESAVYLADEPMSDIEAMIWVQARQAARAGSTSCWPAAMYNPALPPQCHLLPDCAVCSVAVEPPSVSPLRVHHVLARLLLLPPASPAAMPHCLRLLPRHRRPPPQSLPPEVREAKFVGLAALRAEMYDRNLQARADLFPAWAGAWDGTGACSRACSHVHPNMRQRTQPADACSRRGPARNVGSWRQPRACAAALGAAPRRHLAQVLQRMLGEQYMYHKKVTHGEEKGTYKPYYIDMGEPLLAATCCAPCVHVGVLLGLAMAGRR